MDTNKKFKKQKEITRREFLGGAVLGGLLIGNVSRFGSLTAAPNNSGKYQSVLLNTHEWFGDIEERFDLPKEWDVNIHHMAGCKSSVLSVEEIQSRINEPINSRQLCEIAEGKKTAVILFDDVTRATPAGEIMPIVIEELKKGGIRDENILLVCMIGSHRAATQPEMRAKLGDFIVDNYTWINHNCFDNCMDIGKTSRGNRIKVNHYVMKADVKVSISGIRKHSEGGYGGGAKAILPGVSSLDTIMYMHTCIAGMPGPVWTPGTNPSVGYGKIYHNDCRADMEEAARMAGLDFSVQLIINGKRKIIGVYAGDVIESFRSACHEANKLLKTEIAQNSDIVISNCYPRNLQEDGFEWCNWSLRPDGTAVVISQIPLGRFTIHYGIERLGYTGHSFWNNQYSSDPAEKAGQLIIYSRYLQHRDLLNYPKGRVRLVRNWEDVLALLQKAHGPSTSVTVYPYIGLQHEPFNIDGP